jgi:hypothetical protein
MDTDHTALVDEVCGSVAAASVLDLGVDLVLV